MSDAEEFLGAYQHALEEEVMGGAWPPEIGAIYQPESCLKFSPARQVYLVTDRRTGGRAVLRVSQLDREARIDAEYAILSRLDSAGIPKAYGTLVKDGHSYLAREYFDGQPLDQVVSTGGTMPPDRVFAVCRQLCALLGYIHSLRPPVIHRDIKPQNIIMRPDGSLGLTDFGIARTFKEGSTSDTHFVGTMPYAPPEQYGYAQSSPQTDVYALGIVLIYLATGSPDRQELATRIPDKRLRGLIERCIAFDPADRFEDVDQVIKAIDASRPRRGRLVGAIAAGTAALALAGVGVWHLIDPLGTPQGAPSGPGTTQGTGESPGTASGNPSGSPSTDLGARLEGPDAAGNLTGNILNYGLAVEAEGTIYLTDRQRIWQLAADGAILREVPTEYAECQDSELTGLNFWEGQLYFACSKTGIFHYDPAADHASQVFDGRVGDMFIDDGRIYFVNSSDWLRLYVVELDGSGEERVNSRLAHFSMVYRGYHFFIDGDDETKILRTDLASDETMEVYSGEPTWPTVYQGKLYVGEKRARDQGLVTSDLDGAGAQALVSDRATQAVAGADGVFFLTNGYDLHRLALDGAPMGLVTENRVSYYAVAGGWAFYLNADDSDSLWMASLDGATDRRFEPGPGQGGS